MRYYLIALFSMMLLPSNALAHKLWLNSFESFAHSPGHTTISVGWGHSLPIDDMTNDINARTTIEEITLTAPDGHTLPLHTPDTQIAQSFAETSDYAIYDADIACQKIAFKEKTKPGTYLLAAHTKKTNYTRYIDSKGRTRLALKPLNAVKDITKVLFSVQYQAFAKTYFSMERWQSPSPIGQALEITPLTDLSKVKVGDIVEVDVRFHGKPLSYSPTGIEYITAFNPAFAKGKYELFSYISNGKAQFEVLHAGQWIVNVFHNEPVTQTGPLKDLYGKATSANYGATLTFTAK